MAIVYHRPFYRDSSGGLWEAEGSFSKYVESLADRVDEIVLCVPERREPFPFDAYRLDADNVRLCGLSFFDGLPRFYAGLPHMLRRLWCELSTWDLVNLRVPTPLGIYAYFLARLRRRSIFLLVVGDLAGVAASVRVDSPKRLAYRIYLAVEERLQTWMVSGAPTFVNGQALYAKYNRAGRQVMVTTTSTISARDVGDRPDPLADRCPDEPIRLLCVSRIDPRKGLRYLPAALVQVRTRGHDARLTIVGPVVGTLGAEEQARVVAEAERLGISDQVDFVGPRTLPEVMELARAHHAFVLPTLPGEGTPRVLLEAMAAGLPVVATDVGGVPTLVAHDVNGLLVPAADPLALASAIDRLLSDGTLRRRLIASAYTVARAHSAEAHARKIALGLAKMGGIRLRKEGRATSVRPR